MFTDQTMKNIASTGNVWGHTTEYLFNFTVRVWRRNFRFQYRRSKNFMGRFGGGWNIKFGFQSGSLKDLLTLRSAIFEVFVFSIRASAVENKS